MDLSGAAYLVPIFCLGLIIGSFLNVVILRFNTGMPIAHGRSACFACGKALSWYELVPVASFLFLRGKCGECGSKISRQYPTVELLGGAAFVLAYVASGAAVIPFILWAALFCLSIVIAVYDLRHQIIPDELSYAAGLVALALIAWSAHVAGSIDLYRVIAGPALFLFFSFFWLVSRGRWMGFGDAKLALSIGWALGLSSGAAAILLSFWIGAIVSLFVMFYQRLRSRGQGLSLKSAVPFGPFMLVGFFIALALHIDMGTILSYLAV